MRFRPIALLAGLFGFGSLSIPAPTNRQVVIAKSRSAGHTSLGLSLFSPPAYPYIPGLRQSADPKAFGMSETCRRMRRKNKLRAAGVAGSRI